MAVAGQEPLVRRGDVTSVLLAEGGGGEQAGLVRREAAPLLPAPGSVMLSRLSTRDLFLTT